MKTTSSTKMAVVAALDHCRRAGKFVTIPDKSLYVMVQMADAILAGIEADINGLPQPTESERAAVDERSRAMLLHRPKLAAEHDLAQQAAKIA